MPVKLLREEGFAPTGVFYNPNIHPLREYLERRRALFRAASRLRLPLLLPEPENAAWNPMQWLRAVPFCEDRRMRCRACCALRLERTAFWAKEQGFDAFSTGLLYSRRQPHEIIAEEGEKAARLAGVTFLYRDFRFAWREGIELSKEWGLYRQNYCGCLYSEMERHAGALRKPFPEGETRPVFCPPIDRPAASV
jgi:predicted adenine nucleotide alpha hydrolase (AANH) superfamily ATPase